MCDLVPGARFLADLLSLLLQHPEASWEIPELHAKEHKGGFAPSIPILKIVFISWLKDTLNSLKMLF